MPDPNPPPSDRRWRLPRRDLALIPLLSLLTCLVLFAFAEIGTRVFWAESETDTCVIADPVLGHRFKPNCQSTVKSMEGPWVVNDYNECGYRTDQSCAPRPPGVRRVDLMGSSVAQGYLVPYQGTIGANLQATLTQQCHGPVQVENMGMIGYQGDIIASQMDEAQALKPDAIVFLVTPWDFDSGDKLPTAASPPVAQPELLRRIKMFVSASRAVLLAQHFLFVDNQRYGSLYLTYGDRADFIRAPLSPAWRQRLGRLDRLLGQIQAKAVKTGVRIVVAYVPSRVQAVYLSTKDRPPEVDPFVFGRAVGKLVAAHGMAYADMSDTLAHVTNAGSLYYPQDGHIAAMGQTIVGRAIADRVLASVAPFQSCHQPVGAATMSAPPRLASETTP